MNSKGWIFGVVAAATGRGFKSRRPDDVNSQVNRTLRITRPFESAKKAIRVA